MRYFIVFAFGVLIALMLLPSTSWVFKNLADAARYGRSQPDYSDSDGGVDLAPPKNLIDPSMITIDDPKAELARAMLEGESGAAIQRLVRYSRAHPDDPVGWACLLRETCVAGTFRKFDAPNGEPKGYAENHYFRAQEAVQNGMKVDPNNAFFPLLGACVDSEVGDMSSALALLHRASQSTTYDDWVESARETTQRVFETQWGYRGEYQRAHIEAEVLLPHLVHIKKLARMIIALPKNKANLQVREDLFRADNLILRHGNTSIDILVAIACNEILVGNDGAEPSTHGLTDLQRLERDNSNSAKVEHDMKAAGVDVAGASPIRIVSNRPALTKAVDAYFHSVPDITPIAEKANRLAMFFLPISMATCASLGILCLIVWKVVGRVHWGLSLVFGVSLLAIGGFALAANSYDGKLAKWSTGMNQEGDRVRGAATVQS